MGIKYIFRRKNVLEIFKIYIFNVCNLFWCHQQIPLFHSSGHYTIHDCHYKTLKSSITSHHVQIHVILLSEPGESAWRLFAWFSLISNIRQWQIIMTSSVDEYCFLKHWWHWYGKCTRVALGSAKGRACPEGNNICTDGYPSVAASCSASLFFISCWLSKSSPCIYICWVLLLGTEGANRNFCRIKSQIFKNGKYNLKFLMNGPVLWDMNFR